MPNPNRTNDINFRAPRFLLARTITACPHCAHGTPVVALVLPPGHLALEFDHESQEEEHAIDAWRIANAAAFVFYVEFIPAAVQSRLTQFNRFYRRCGAGPDSHWANHCERCGLPLDDDDLYCEPEGAFLPINEESASLIHLVPIEEPFEAVAGGYAYEPAHFGAIR